MKVDHFAYDGGIDEVGIVLEELGRNVGHPANKCVEGRRVSDESDDVVALRHPDPASGSQRAVTTGFRAIQTILLE